MQNIHLIIILNTVPNLHSDGHYAEFAIFFMIIMIAYMQMCPLANFFSPWLNPSLALFYPWSLARHVYTCSAEESLIFTQAIPEVMTLFKVFSWWNHI